MKVEINNDKCTKCYTCVGICPSNAIVEKDNSLRIEQPICINCYACILVCPYRAISIRKDYLGTKECIQQEKLL